MSMWHLISGASVLVQLVMLALVLASIASWVLIFRRCAVTRAAERSVVEFEDRFRAGIDLANRYRQVTGKRNPHSGLEQVFRGGCKEFSRMRQQRCVEPEAVMDAVQRARRGA